MRARPNPVEKLASLIRIEDAAELRANWRQAIAALGTHGSFGVSAAPPLEGIAQDVIARAAEVAIDVGLADDLDWLAPGPATVALYEITAALPPGKARRELGRRVFARVYEGTAATFAAVAARMALTSGRPLETAPLRARLGLLFDLPIGTSVNADPLALTLVSRRELRERWVDARRTGTLPARRLAAKLIEHAAREAVFRAHQGDSQPRELLASDELRGARVALLSDREPLVWRHVAVARGLLAAVDPELRQEIELALDPSLSPTEWRPAAASLVALCVFDPIEALRSCVHLMSSSVAELDEGVLRAMVLGLPRVIEAEPDVARELIARLAATRRPDVAEALGALLSDVKPGVFTCEAVPALRDALGIRIDEAPPSTLRALSDPPQGVATSEERPDIVGMVRRALDAYETRGARAAFELATQAVLALGQSMDSVAAADLEDERGLAQWMTTLSDIDAAALERPRLRELLLLGRRPGDTDTGVPELEHVYDRLGRWLLRAEAAPPSSDPAFARAGQRRLRTLLHLMDVDTTRVEDDKRVRTRVGAVIRLLLPRVVREEPSPARHSTCAALARACDAAVREGLAEPAELLLAIAAHGEDATIYSSIGETSTNPDVRGVLVAYAEFLRADAVDGAEPAAENTLTDGVKLADPEEEARVGERVVRLSRGLGVGGSYRGEALRRIVLRVGRALEAVAAARSLTELVDSSGSGSDLLGELESAMDDLDRLKTGAVRRVLGDDRAATEGVTDAPAVGALVERAVRSADALDVGELQVAIGKLTVRAPAALGSAVARVLVRVAALPIAAQSEVFAIPLERRRAQLPDWLLPHRTIGAFYVVRSLGRGGASSVFLARRLEERTNTKAEGFALKVPDYDPTTARSLSEQQFLQLFREEAGALLALPLHENLARFVTFDAGARPKPILVMELIRGVSLDRLIRSRSLSVSRVLSYLQGILGGLRAMHAAGVAHLDVKPSNVILRNGEIPVLVDFGLSGRHLRPGCGTVDYCAPEVLGEAPADWTPQPSPTDIYAFACTAFEALTAQSLFDGDDETRVLAAHLSHDGWPDRLAKLAHVPETLEIAKLLAACLRRDPRLRPSAAQAEAALRRISGSLSNLEWPIAGRTEPQLAVG